MSSFKCPFCGRHMSTHSETHKIWPINFSDNNYARIYDLPHLQVNIYKCPSEDCQKESVIVQGVNGYIDDASVNIYPQCLYISFPEYIPFAIRSDYEEACAIVSLSPKAAATLARRCLQGMIHDFWDIHEKNLNAEITSLKSHISAAQWKAIDAVRSIGNIGAHMEHNVDCIIDVEPQEALLLLRLIEHLIEKWYVDRHETELLYSEVSSIASEKSAIRKS